ncbi:MAG: putative inositol monophosphatase [Ilumatobacteraceae bacterium]|nr:putative inositol monophosphatase [Ilumatobacteraceae bacterium]MCU1387315.1 putative inositol monophosphatase [Ilumatobacteraceae bacterium]
MTNDSDAAADIATIAGALLLDIRAAGGPTDGLKASGDRGSHELIMGELARRFPHDAVLSEEGTDSAARLGRPRVWIVDPLDGTREFSEPPRTDWAVHVALVVDGVLTVGAVALPAQGRTLSTAGATTAPLPQRPAHDGAPRLVVSRTRPTEHARVIAEQLHAELVPMGSAGAKAMAVVLGEADIYAHSGGQYEWDSAAPVAVAQAAGLHVSRLDGSPLIYNQPDPWLPDLLICRPDLAVSVIEICRSIA